VRGTTRVQHRPCVRERLHHLAGTAGVIEVHVGQEQVVHLLARDPEFVQRGQEPRGRRRRPRVDEGGMTLIDHQVARREAGAQVQRVDQVHAVAERLREGRVVAGAGAGVIRRYGRSGWVDGLGCVFGTPKTRRPGSARLFLRQRRT